MSSRNTKPFPKESSPMGRVIGSPSDFKGLIKDLFTDSKVSIQEESKSKVVLCVEPLGPGEEGGRFDPEFFTLRRTPSNRWKVVEWDSTGNTGIVEKLVKGKIIARQVD